MRPSVFILVALALIALTSAAHGDDVTVAGNVAFSSLDGSMLDHDGARNGVFTVNDGNLTILGTVSCNDEGLGNASACAMRFVVSGDIVVAAGGALHAENLRGSGSGGSITLNAGENLIVRTGAVISSAAESGNDAGGNIAFEVAGNVTLDPGSIVSAASANGRAGTIEITAAGRIDIDGLVASGPGRALSAAAETTDVLSGGSAKQRGGTIAIRSTAQASGTPAVKVGPRAAIVSQGRESGSDLILLEGRGLAIRGLIASVADGGSDSAVTLRSGTTLLVDGRDRSNVTSAARGWIRAAASRDASRSRVRVLSRGAIEIYGPAGSLYALNANPAANNAGGGTIEIVSTEDEFTGSGNVARAGDLANGSRGGRVRIAAKHEVIADAATLVANGGALGAGGSIALRSHSGAVSWTFGTGDVRPVASATAPIVLTYCTTVSTTGSAFPTDGVAMSPSLTQSCTPTAPSLPVGEPDLPSGNQPPANVPPIATNDDYIVGEGGTLHAPLPGVLANDVDPDGPSSVAILVSAPVHIASFSFNADGSFSYVHDGSDTTSDSFTYKVSDGAAESNVATVTIAISAVNDPPIAYDDAYAFAEGGTLSMLVPGVLANDVDPDGPAIQSVLLTAPVHASSFTLNGDGSFTYVHDGSETTSDAFTYKLTDGSAESAPATVTLTVTAVNDAPAASADAYGVDEGGTITVAAPGILGNDSDAENAVLRATLVSGPLHASSFTLNADGSFTYAHDGSEAASDSFTYQAHDGFVASSVVTVTITVVPINEGPSATADAYNVDEGGTLAVATPGVLANDIDPDNQNLTAIVVAAPSHASSFTLHADGSFSYVHDGGETTSDSFTYKAHDGALDSSIATVTIAVNAVNDPPTATAHSGLPAQAGIPITYPAGKLGGTDVESGTTVTIDTAPVNVVNGTVSLNANGSFVFTPLPAAVGGTASFQYRVADNGSPAPGASSAYVTVSFQVAGPAIYFTRSIAAGLGNCTLGNECTVATALAQIGSSPNANIFIGDNGTQTLGSIALNPGGTIIGQGVQVSTFDSVFGIVSPAQGTLAPRPVVNQQQARPTLATTIILNSNSHVRGLNLTPSADGLVAVGRTGLVVAQVNITSSSNDPNTFCVNFTGSSGSFLFGNIAVSSGRNGSGVRFVGPTTSPSITFANVTMGGSGNAVTIADSGTTGFSFQTVTSNSGRAVDIDGAAGQITFFAVNANGADTGILVRNTTGTFGVNGTNGNPGTGGTIQNCTSKGADFRNARNINLRGMVFLNNATVDGPSADCGRIDLSTANNGPLNCNASISLLSTTSVLIATTTITGSKQIGIDGQSVNNLAMQGTTVANNGDAPDEDGVQLSNVTGNLTINSNNTYRDAAGHLFEIVNDSGSLNASLTSSTFRHSSFSLTPSAAGVRVTARGSAFANAFIGSSTFTNINAAAIELDYSGAATGTINVGGLTHAITFINNAQAVALRATGTGLLNYNIRENTLTNDPLITSNAARTPFVVSLGGAATRTGVIDNNTIGTNALAALGSGCIAAGCDGIQISDTAATGSHRVTISNNRVFHVDGAAIRLASTGGSSESLRARIVNNIADFPDNPASSSSAIVVEDTNSSPAGVLLTCLDVAGNQVSGLWAAATSHKSAIRIAATRAQQFALTNFNPATEYPAGAVTAGCTSCTGAAATDGNVSDFLSQQNPATVTAQNLSGGSSASQERLATSAEWTGVVGTCP